MTRTTLAVLFLSAVAVLPAPVSAAVPVQRYMLVIGANSGGADRPRLQYAISDAERFARVMGELGGVSPANQIVLKQPTAAELVSALTRLAARVEEARRAAIAAGGGRTEFVVYYSGHADEQGLLLGSERYSYRSLRDRLETIAADVRIAVLDACASGAFTRLKGGRARPPFLVDESSDMRGHAFLTSSAESEAAQESDRIGASYFTHYLVSGFRGAADVTGDGRVTLNEAYQFAFSETLRRTVDTKGGPQHPSYEINLSGTGDVVMTDVRQTTAILVLDEELDGRFFVRTSSQELVVELYKPLGRSVELGLEPGAYEVRLERDKGSLVTKTQIAEGARVVLAATQFGPATLEPTRRRGAEAAIEPPRFAVSGRNRVEVRIGAHFLDSRSPNAVLSGVGSDDLLAGVLYTRFLREDLAVTAGAHLISSEVGSSVNTHPLAVFEGTADVVALPIGVRWYPFRAPTPQPLKPFATGGITVAIGDSSGNLVTQSQSSSGFYTGATVGPYAGGGIELFLARGFAISVDAGYTWLPDFSQQVGSRANYSGAQIGVGFGWVFGHGDTK